MTLPIKTSQKKLRAFAVKNQKHHLAAPRTLYRSTTVKARLMQARKNYLTELSKRKGLEWISKRIRLPKIDEKSGYELIKSGLSHVQLKIIPLNAMSIIGEAEAHKVAFVLDPLGRIRFFCKKEDEQLFGDWKEIRNFRISSGKQTCLEAKEFGVYPTRQVEEYDLTYQLREQQRQMNFDDKNVLRKLILLKRLL